MATTTNYGWETPDNTDLVKDGALAIRTLGSSIDTTTKALNPSTTLGDIEYRSATANTNTRLGIGSTGQVLTVAGGVPTWSTPGSGSNYVGVSLYNSASTFSISNATNTALTFDSENFDTDGFHSTSSNTSRITIPSGKEGKYQITGALTWANAGGARRLDIFKNGTVYCRVQDFGDASNQTYQNISAVLNLGANDYVELFVFQNSGSSLNIYGATAPIWCWFEASRLGA